MEGVKIKSHKEILAELNFESKDSISKSLSIVKNEYLKNLYKVYFFLILLFVIFIIYHSLSSQLLKLAIGQIPTIVEKIQILDQIVTWILFSLYISIYFFQLSFVRFSPSLVNFLKMELIKLDLEILKKYKIELRFFLFIIFSIIAFILINIGIYFYNNSTATFLIVRIIIIFIISSISIPILRGVLHDKFVVKLKNHYFVQFELQFRLIRSKELESQMIKVYMSSNKLCLKSEQYGLNLYKEISEKKWLPKKGRLIFPMFYFNPSLHFHEYSTLINFKDHFVNIVSAIREWDVSYKKD